MADIIERLRELPPRTRKIVRVAIPTGILIVGILGMYILTVTRTEAQMSEPESAATPVEVVTTELGDSRVMVHATGTVQPTQQVQLEAQVSGRIEWVSGKLRPGGKFRRGETILRIDDADYQVALQQAEASLQRAQVMFEQERGRKDVAEREWQLLEGLTASERGRSLALREPQLREAEAQVRAAEAAVEQARLNISRTRLTAPFPCIVESETVDVGQIVRPGVPLASLVGSQTFRVEVPVPYSDLGWLPVPGSDARITLRTGNGKDIVRHGEAVELLSGVERGGMMAQVLLHIDDPLGISRDHLPPILVGSIVEVDLHGSDASGVYPIPRETLRRNNTVWTVNGDNTLRVVPVEIVHRAPDVLLVTGDLGQSAQIVASPLATPIDGMALEVRRNEPDKEIAATGGNR